MALKIRTIGACDVPKRMRTIKRKYKDWLRKRQVRRARGMRPHSESLSATQPWREEGMSRTTWYRKNKARKAHGTVLSAVHLYSSTDRVVPVERVKEEIK